MEKIKNNFFKFISSRYFPFIVFMFMILFFHACIHVGHGDDEFFKNVLTDKNIFDWLTSRYNGWSSRVIIEFFLATISQYPILWRVLDTFIMVLGAFSISELFNFRKSAEVNWVICALVFCLPISLYTSAGWIATTLNYSWVAFLGLFSLLPIKKIFSHDNIKCYEYIFCFLALIYAANQEQMCFILFAVYFVFSCYMFYKDKKINWFLSVCTILTLIMIIFIITCPGNANRKIEEAVKWFPEYNNISILRKIEMGFSSTLFEFIMNPNCVFFIFSLLLFIRVNLKCKNKLCSFIAIVPLACNFIFSFLADIIGKRFPNIVAIKNSMTPYGTGLQFEPRTWVPDIILLLMCVSIIISLYILFKDKKIFFLTVFVLLLGFGSRMVMSFSPTIWSSELRTFMFMYLSIIICSVILYQALNIEKNKIAVEFVNYFIFILSIMSFTNMLYIV